jgi:hypothetical protein
MIVSGTARTTRRVCRQHSRFFFARPTLIVLFYRIVMVQNLFDHLVTVTVFPSMEKCTCLVPSSNISNLDNGTSRGISATNFS